MGDFIGRFEVIKKNLETGKKLDSKFETQDIIDRV